jgi:hypothetical protein
MSLRNTNMKSATFSVAALLVVSVIVAAISFQEAIGQTNQSGLKFFIKYSKSANSNSTSQGAVTPGSTNSTSATTKKITVNVNLQKGPGGTAIKLPITATVPASAKTEDLQLCAALPTGSQSCQPLSAKGANIDLTKKGSAAGNSTGTNGAASPPITSPKAYNNNDNAKITSAVFSFSTLTQNTNLYTPVESLIGITNTSVNIPVTVIVPVNVQIQNAQVCASVLSGGSQSCEQLVLNPSQTTFSPINVNLATPTPTFSSAPLSASTQPTTTNPLSSTTNALTPPSTSTPPPSTSTPPPSTSTPPPSTSTPPPSTSTPPPSTSTPPSTGSGSSGSTK